MTDLLTTSVVICETNETRADLYALWLDRSDVHRALTERAAREAIDATTAVVIVSERFGSGPAAVLRDVVDARAPFAQAIVTHDAGSLLPDLDAEMLPKPVFEAALTALVERLLLRANYHLALKLYYQTTAHLSAYQVSEPLESMGPEEGVVELLEDRAERLRTLVQELRGYLASEDILKVKRRLQAARITPRRASEERIRSKYQPNSCSRCGVAWDRSTGADETRVRKLGAHVWRCGECGHVQMASDPSHRSVGRYRP